MENTQKTQTSLFQQLTYLVFMAGTFILPFIFLPNFPNSFELPKWAIIVFMAVAGLLFWGLEILTTKEFKVKITTLTKPFLALAIIYVASTLINSSNRVAPFWGRTGLFLALAVFYITGTTMLGKRAKNLFWALVSSSFLVAWVSIFSYLEILPKIIPGVAYLADKRFTPTGGPLPLITFLVVLLPTTIILGLRKKDSLVKVLLFVVSAIQAIALILTVSLIIPGQPSGSPILLLPYSAGWSIAVDQFKSFRTAMLGVGPGDFVSAFSRFRPVWLNGGDFWNIRFTSSSNEIFMAMTVTGLAGLAVLGWLFLAVIRLLKRTKAVSINIGLGLGLALALMLFFFVPANPVLMFAFVALAMGLGIDREEASYTIKKGLKSPFNGIFAAVVAAIVLATAFLTGQVLAAEQAYGQALDAVRNNNGTLAYNALIKAQQRNPFDVRYRIDYANVNLALANNLASNKDLTDNERETILQLISQSIREGKNATALAPNNPVAWENLANIYRQLVNFAQGAEQWALTAYIQAIRLDPTNPALRVSFGGLLYSLQSYDDAIDQFKRAIDLKPDYANAFYNLSYAYRQKNDILQAYNAMQATVSLVKNDTVDFDTANAELQQLWELLPQEYKTATQAAEKKPGELEAPQPYPSPRPAGRLPIDNQQQRQDLAPVSPESTQKEGENTEPLPKPEEVLVPKPTASPEL